MTIVLRESFFSFQLILYRKKGMIECKEFLKYDREVIKICFINGFWMNLFT